MHFLRRQIHGKCFRNRLNPCNFVQSDNRKRILVQKLGNGEARHATAFLRSQALHPTYRVFVLSPLEPFLHFHVFLFTFVLLGEGSSE
jgi:hypothetical protein